MEKIREIVFFILFGQFLDFAVYGSWEAVHSLEMMSPGVGTFSTIENLILGTFFFQLFGDPLELFGESLPLNFLT